jgi:hypothetical protein
MMIAKSAERCFRRGEAFSFFLSETPSQSSFHVYTFAACRVSRYPMWMVSQDAPPSSHFAWTSILIRPEAMRDAGATVLILCTREWRGLKSGWSGTKLWLGDEKWQPLSGCGQQPCGNTKRPRSSLHCRHVSSRLSSYLSCLVSLLVRGHSASLEMKRRGVRRVRCARSRAER